MYFDIVYNVDTYFWVSLFDKLLYELNSHFVIQRENRYRGLFENTEMIPCVVD